MNRLIQSVLVLTVFENISTALAEHGTFFYTHEKLAFGALPNLALGVVSGLCYVIGAAKSHAFSRRLGERNVLLGTMVLQIVTAGLMAFLALPMVLDRGVMSTLEVSVWLSVLFCVLSLLFGVKWPVIESYLAAGQTPAESASSVGWFNLGWSGGVVVAVAVAGWLLKVWAPWLFVVPVITSVLAIGLVLRWPARPVHLENDHPQRPSAVVLSRYGRLLVSSRWQMFTSYALYFVMVPLFPIVFRDLGVGVAMATVFASMVALARFLTFAAMHRWKGWHGRPVLLWVGLVLAPLSAWAVLVGDALWVVVVGQLVFGFSAGLCYFSALYYALVIHNAGVEAGGDHEAVIGAGFVVGPVVGLGATKLGVLMGNAWLGMTLGLLPLLAVGTYKGAAPLAQLLREDRARRDAGPAVSA